MSTLAPLLCCIAPIVGAQTTVSARAPDDASTHLVEDGGSADPASALGALPGAALVRDGAPLAPARLSVRGVSGARVSASFLGLTLSDPLDGMLDVENVPWVAVRLAALTADERALRLEPDLRGARVRARVVAGSLATLRTGVLLDVPTSGGHALVAVDAGTTRGDFSFALPNPAPAQPATLLVRENDDHRRLSAAAFVSERSGIVDVEASALASMHEGGVPGFAAHPTDALRRFDRAGAARARAQAELGLASPFITLGVRGAEHATWQEGRAARDTVAADELEAGAGADLVGPDIAATLAARASSARAFTASTGAVERRVGGAAVAATLALPFGLDASAHTSGEIVSDVGPLLSARARIAGGDAVRAALTVSRSSRAPTLDELYAPRGFVLGNPELAPEVLDDVEASVRIRAHRVLALGAALWAGRIEDTILYLNRNAFEVVPVNTGPALRAGVDGAVAVSPARWLGIDTVCSLLSSRVDATGAPLPLAPSFLASTALRLGPSAGGHLIVRASSRGPSSATQFGTIEVPGYTLIDARARYPIGAALALGVSLHNAFDVLDARDQNGLPLPGRLMFFSLEVTG